MIWLIVLIVLLIAFSLPQWWVQRTLKRHSATRPDFPGNGAEMARHLLHKLDIDGVDVEASEQGDHYDPSAKMVRLTQDKYEGKSLTAVVVAAHEVGHALQHHKRETLFQSRTRLAWISFWLQKLAPLALLFSPMLVGFNPAVGRWALAIGVLSLLANTLLQLITLPVEWDASFNKALPILEKGGYFERDEDYRHAREILRAAALTYVAAALADLLNIWRWLRLLKR